MRYQYKYLFIVLYAWYGIARELTSHAQVPDNNNSLKMSLSDAVKIINETTPFRINLYLGLNAWSDKITLPGNFDSLGNGVLTNATREFVFGLLREAEHYAVSEQDGIFTIIPRDLGPTDPLLHIIGHYEVAGTNMFMAIHQLCTVLPFNLEMGVPMIIDKKRPPDLSTGYPYWELDEMPKVTLSVTNESVQRILTQLLPSKPKTYWIASIVPDSALRKGYTGLRPVIALEIHHSGESRRGPILYRLRNAGMPSPPKPLDPIRISGPTILVPSKEEPSLSVAYYAEGFPSGGGYAWTTKSGPGDSSNLEVVSALGNSAIVRAKPGSTSQRERDQMLRVVWTNVTAPTQRIERAYGITTLYPMAARLADGGKTTIVGTNLERTVKFYFIGSLPLQVTSIYSYTNSANEIRRERVAPPMYVSEQAYALDQDPSEVNDSNVQWNIPLDDELKFNITFRYPRGTHYHEERTVTIHSRRWTNTDMGFGSVVLRLTIDAGDPHYLDRIKIANGWAGLNNSPIEIREKP